MSRCDHCGHRECRCDDNTAAAASLLRDLREEIDRLRDLVDLRADNDRLRNLLTCEKHHEYRERLLAAAAKVADLKEALREAVEHIENCYCYGSKLKAKDKLERIAELRKLLS